MTNSTKPQTSASLSAVTKPNTLILPSPLANGVIVIRDLMSALQSSAFQLPPELADAHPRRKSGWQVGRLVLHEAFAKMGIDLKPSDTTFVEHQRLISYPEFRFSISHNESHAGCWLIRETHGLRQIGFDLESTNRKVRADLDSRLNIQGAEHLKFLERWSIRESIFKALNPKQQSFFLADTVVLGDQTFELNKQKISGRFDVQHPVEDLIVTFAWI